MKVSAMKNKMQAVLAATTLTMLCSMLACLAQSSTELDPCGTPDSSQRQGPSSAEWVIKSQIEAAPKMFEHECFKTRSLVKASVDYFENGKEARKTAYEDLWFHEGHALGLERKASFAVPQDKSVDIEIKSSPCPSLVENKAAAGAIMRLALDLKINNDHIHQVTVPYNAFNDISAVLQSRNFRLLPAGQETPAEASIVLNLQADYGNAKQTLYYSKLQ